MDNYNFKVSIITVSFNSEKTIGRTIESVLYQTYSNIEYIIIDGLSNDSTLDIANSYREKFAEKEMEYKVVSAKDQGIYDAMNKGIKMATGHIVGIINSDDWYENIAVETMLKSYTLFNFDIMYGGLNIVRDNKKNIIKKARLMKFMSTRHWNHPTMFVKRNVYTELGLYKLDNIYADWDFFLRAKKANLSIYIVEDVLANFSTNGVSHRKSIRDFRNRLVSRYKCYRQNNYSVLYSFESLAMEIIKLIM
ncbi:MAG: glycosyltransferase family 2 protein [Acholeplasma sp.]|nr:glycosyltransferase family 2 protein [Acholeplasma sp.]